MAAGTQEKQYTPSLLSFFVYNPSFGPREGEEEKKILFYHPSEVEKNEKIPSKVPHTQKNRQFFFEPEDNFWIVMIVRNPMVEKPNKDGKPPTVEYQEEEVLDTVYGAVLRQCYSMYKLFNGTFGRAMDAGGVELLLQKTGEYLQTLHLQSCDLLDVFGGISFFPLDKMSYLKIQSFVNRVEESLHLVKYTAFLYNDQLIWDSSLRPEVAGNLLHYGRFLTGPANLKDPEAKFRFPRIFVHTEQGHEELHLVVYKAMSAAVCFMISASVELTRDFCERLDALVGPQLTLLASDICEHPRMAAGTQEKQYTPSLLSFFVYNPSFGPREGEEEKKILFYHPSEVEKNEKIRNPAKSLHTQKNRQFFFEPEDNFWIVMIVRNPMVEKPNKDGKPPTVEYQEEEVLDTVYGAVLRQCYSMYKLFNGTFGRAMDAGGVELLLQKLEKFFYRYLQTLHLQSCDLLDVPDKEPQFKFIYFNHMNLAEKSTVHMRKTASVSLTSVHPDLMKILGDINSMTDYWVVGKKSDQRELYVILNQKNANLIEVNEEVKRLCATQFNNIFFLD
ncbi:hypothetical protein CRUP_024734 [Coryphaenoides rupestris]|nr:hypothetical protein CRUP_024734 [Coryphaenoides rupestris]